MKLQPLGNIRKLFQNLWQIKAANDIGWNCHGTRFYSFRHRISGVQSLFNRSLILPTGTRKECNNHFNRKYRHFQNLCFRQASQTEVKQPVKATLQQDGKIVAIDWSKDESSKFHSVWLRHNCQCRRCIQEGSGQRIFDSSEISHELNLQSIEVKDSVVHFKWSDVSNHDGEISLDYLQANCYSPSSIKNRYSAVQINKLAKEIPVVNYTDVVKKKEELYRWLHFVNEYGICLLKDVPAEDKAVLAVADLIGPIQETNYGKTFDVKSAPNPVNIAYTSVALSLHTDLVYMESPPGLQLLHCIRFDDCVEGGESTYLDLFHVVEEFRKSHPRYFQILSTIPATFYKCHYDRENPYHLVYQKPHIILNHRKQVVGLNWAPPFEGPLLVEEDDVLMYYEAYEELAKAIKNSDKMLTYGMKVGDLMIFNNHRVLHGRNEFKLNDGIRHLQGCYIGIDDFKCKVQVLSNQVGDGQPPKHVGNQSWL